MDAAAASAADGRRSASLRGRSVLVLGGSVFVGRHLVDALLRDGANVAVLNRGRSGDSFGDDVERLIADRTVPEQMQAVLAQREWDAVFDVSGFVMAAGGSDIEGLIALLDGRVGRYVFTSSIMAYDQSWRGVFPWTEEQPTNPTGPATYGGFKAMAEAAMLARHRATGFPATIARPAAIYGPDNNIFDMETPMFLRLLRHLPILVPHAGLVVGSYGHVDDLCDAMIAMATAPEATGEVFNITGEAVDVLRYITTLADIVGESPEIVDVPSTMVAELEASAPAVYGHLFKSAHHASLSTSKLAAKIGVRPRYDLRSGHLHTYEWFRSKGWDQLSGSLADPVWRSSWDFDAEARCAERIRRG